MSRSDTVRRSLGVFAVGVLAAMLGVTVAAADEAESEDLSRWSHFHELPRPGAAATQGDFVLTPSVFGKARENLGDLRLVDQGTGKVIPYALRIRKPTVEKRELPGKALGNVVNKADQSAEFTLDLGENPEEYNQIVVNAGPLDRSYFRKLRVEGSHDNQKWGAVLDEAHLVYDVRRKDQPAIDRREFTVSPARYRYLRVRVQPDRNVEKDQPKVDSVQVFRMASLPGERASYEAVLGQRQPVRHNGQFASAWDLDLGEENVPVSRLTLKVKEGLTRPFELVILERDRVGSGVAWGGPAMERRQPDGAGIDWDLDEKGGYQQGVRVTPEGTEISFPETRARKLRLIVIDSRNTPLTIEKATFSGTARQVIFPVSADVKGPLRLYSGNPDAPPPNYDFGTRLPLKLTTERVTPGERQDNTAYVPPPKPWTERWPYLADVILALACVVLGGLLLRLARGAIRRHDALPVATQEPTQV